MGALPATRTKPATRTPRNSLNSLTCSKRGYRNTHNWWARTAAPIGATGAQQLHFLSAASTAVLSTRLETVPRTSPAVMSPPSADDVAALRAELTSGACPHPARDSLLPSFGAPSTLPPFETLWHPRTSPYPPLKVWRPSARAGSLLVDMHSSVTLVAYLWSLILLLALTETPPPLLPRTSNTLRSFRLPALPSI